MDPATILSTIGLVVAVANPIPNQMNVQSVTGEKVCENNISFKALLREETGTLYIKSDNGTIFVLQEKKVDTGVRRFESKDKTLVYIQQPHKAVVLDGKNMRPLIDECRNSA